MASSSPASPESLIQVFRPSALLRWPLYLMNGFLVLALAVLGVTAIMLHNMSVPLPLTLLVSGAAMCLTFFTVNSSVLSLRLHLNDRGATLRLWPWRRTMEWRGCQVQKIFRPVGVTAVRIISSDGRRIWLSSGWFAGFEQLHFELERLAREHGGKVTLAPS